MNIALFSVTIVTGLTFTVNTVVLAIIILGYMRLCKTFCIPFLAVGTLCCNVGSLGLIIYMIASQTYSKTVAISLMTNLLSNIVFLRVLPTTWKDTYTDISKYYNSPEPTTAALQSVARYDSDDDLSEIEKNIRRRRNANSRYKENGSIRYTREEEDYFEEVEKWIFRAYITGIIQSVMNLVIMIMYIWA